LDAGRAGIGLAGVVLELAADLVTAGLGHARPGDLGLDAGEAQKSDKFVQEGAGIGSCSRHVIHIDRWAGC
jgi:hypothetical protein